MKCLLLLGLVAVVSALSNVRGGAIADLHASAKKLQALNQERPNIRGKVLQAGNATACYEAWFQLDLVLNSSCGQITEIYDPNLSGVNVSDYVNAQCVVRDANNYTCQEKVTFALTEFSNYCSGPGMTVMDSVTRASLDMWLTIANVPCLQDSGRYCFPIFRTNMDAFLNATGGSNVAITAPLLDEVCDTCVLKVIDTLATWGVKDFISASATLKIACTKRDNTYCFPVFLEVSSTDHSLNTTSDLDAVCSDCMRIIAYRLYIANLLLGSSANMTQREELQNYLEYSAFVCQKNEVGTYCVVLLDQNQPYIQDSVLPACAPIVMSQGTSPCAGTSCQKALTTFSTSVGCCLGTWFTAMNYTYINDPAAWIAGVKTNLITPTTIKNAVQGYCGVPVPTGCAKKKLMITFTVSNILQAWYNAHVAWFEAQFKVVIAYILSINPNLVVDVTSSYSTAKLGVMVNVNISGFSDDDVNSYNEYLSNALAANDANDVIVSIKDDSSNGSQVTQIIQPITVSAQSTITCTGSSCNTNFASALSPSFFSLLLLVSILAYFR